MKSRWMVVLGFLGTIFFGAFLLMLPVSSPSHTWMRPMDALFTSCSAVCVTGLSVIDVGQELSRFGQCVLLALVQIGCVGLMTFATFFLVLVGRRLSLSSEFSLMNAYGVSGVRGWRGLVIWVFLSMQSFELLGMAAVRACLSAAPSGVPADPATASPWFRAYFYSVMSFCNAGFGLSPISLAVFQGQPVVLFVLTTLMILGGLGFLVIYNLCTIQFWRRNLVKRGRLTLHTRVVLTSTFTLLVLATVVLLVLEWNGTLAPFSWQEKIPIGLCQAAASRTCGFTIAPVSEMHPASRFLIDVLMFIGGAPGSAAGGIKVTTLAVFLVTVAAICRGRREPVIFKRAIPEAAVREAIVIVVVFAGIVVMAVTALLVAEAQRPELTFEALLFEAVSAVSTTGLSCGSTTASLSPVGRVIIMLCMFGGRLGAMAVVMLIGGQDDRALIRYPKEELVVG